jgi:predicted nucleic acid-binding protein
LHVISNSSPLIALAQIGRIELLRSLHGTVLVPPAVALEVKPTLSQLPEWILTRSPESPLQPAKVSRAIGPGEREAISLGLELQPSLLILDEQPGRRLATSLGLSVIGTVGLMVAAKAHGLLSALRPEFDRLRGVRFFIDQELIDQVLAQAGE